MTSSDWLAVVLMLLGMTGGLPLIRLITRRCGASPEVARKSVHVVMGLACMTFPWVFDHPEPVWMLTAMASMPLVALRMVPGLREGIGSALHGVKRLSYGEVLFVPAVAAVFHLSAGDLFLYCIPVAILTISDAAGALGGSRWGRHRYGSGEGFKSMEGSVAFLLTAIACVLFPLWFGGRTGFWQALWISLILGQLAMMAEGMADRGFDNLVIPVGCFFVLARLLTLDPTPLAWHFVVAVFFLALVVAGSRWSTLSGGALLGCALLGYGCAVLADFRFILPPLAVFFCHVVVTRRNHLMGVFDHRLDAVLAHAIGCLPWVILVERGVLPADVGLAGVSFAMATQLGLMHTGTHWWVKQRPAGLGSTVAKGWGIAALPGLIWLWHDSGRLAPPVCLALAISVIAVGIFRKMRPQEIKNTTRFRMLQGCIALLTSLPALAYLK